MDAYEIIISMAALNKTWEKLLQGEGIAGSDITGRIMEQYPNPLLKMAGITPCSTDPYCSTAVEHARTRLKFAGILTEYVPGSEHGTSCPTYRWTCPQKPEKYFNEAIKPWPTGEHINELRQLANSLTALNPNASRSSADEQHASYPL